MRRWLPRVLLFVVVCLAPRLPSAQPSQVTLLSREGRRAIAVTPVNNQDYVALDELAPMLADGPTEADVRDELEHRMRRLGASGPSYDTIVASGPDNAARPHHATGRRTIVEGDTVIVDVGEDDGSDVI